MKRLKLLLKSVREYKIPSILTVIFVVLETSMEMLLPFVMKNLVDEIQNINENLTNFYIYSGILLGLALFALLFGFLNGYFGGIASSGYAKNLREDLFNKIQTYSFSNIDKFSTSSIVTRLTTDVQNIRQTYQMCIRIVIRAPLLFIFSIVMSFIIGGHMAWIFIGIIPLITFGLIIIIKKAMPVFVRVFKKYDKLNEATNENIRGIRVVKSYVNEEYEKKKFYKASKNIRDEFISAEKIDSFNNPLMMFGINLANLLICLIGAILIVTTFRGYTPEGEPLWGTLSNGSLSALLNYGFQILMSLMIVSMVFIVMSMSVESIRRASELLEEKSKITNTINPIYDIKDGSIEFKHVNFKYSEKAPKYALENIELSIKSGETIGIIGSTGSGKTSLVNLISRLYDTSEGEILIGGIDVKKYDLDTLRNQVSVVLQKNVLFSGTIESNLKWGDKDASEEEIKKACSIACADEFIESFKDKYQSKIEQGGSNVSGGQKQRLCIARAILKKPKILILDDSTSAIDTKTDSKIRESFKLLLPNTTKIIIAQRISSLESADRIIVMNNGKIDQIGTHEDLIFSNEIYKEVYYTQNKKGGN